MEKILVTGCAGFIGSHTVEKLLAAGKSVIGIDDFNDYYEPIIKRNNADDLTKYQKFVLVEGDIRDKSVLKELFDEWRVNKVIHLAARAGVRASLENPALYHDVNVTGTRNLLELSAECNIGNFVFASSSSVYGNNTKIPFSEEDEVTRQISPYAKTKREGELLCREFHDARGLNISCLRFFTVYGPRGRPDMAPYKFTHHIYQDKEIEVYGDGKSQRDYTFIDDIVEGVLSAAEKKLGFEIINLGNSFPIELMKFIEIIERNLGRKAKIRYTEPQEGDVQRTFADITKARKLLGYNPRTSIEEGMKKMINWYISSIVS